MSGDVNVMHVPDICASSVEEANIATDQLNAYIQLRNLAVSDPRQARQQITLLLDTSVPELEYFLRQAAAPGEGRIRHLVASVLRSHPAKAKVAHHLEHWLTTETDAFARRAVEEALRGLTRATSTSRVKLTENNGVSDLIARAYHQVAEQLRHEVRNALLEIQTPLRELQTISESLPADSPVRIRLEEQIRLARTGTRNTGRLVEFDTGDDRYFSRRTIVLYDWLISHALRYVETLTVPPILHVEASSGVRSLTVIANDHLLNIVFKNLWSNARQVTGEHCVLTARISVNAGKIVLLMMDNGPGFDTVASEMAFQNPFSTKGAGRGRGLLEIDEAMRELGGAARLEPVALNEFRIVLYFPLEAA